MVEVFRTNVNERLHADTMILRLSTLFPHYRVTFALDDCDRILRVQAPGSIDVERVIAVLGQAGFACSVLED